MRRLRPAAALLAALLLASALPGGDARAQQASADVARAADAKKRGDEAMDSLRYADALAAYAEAYAATKDPALLYNEGRAYQALGDYPSALVELQRFDAQASAELKARVPRLNELLADVRGRVATLVIHANVKDARILVREKVAGTTSDAAPIQVNAGRAFVEIGAEGYQTYRKEIDLPGGQTTTLDIALVSKDRAGVLVVRSAAAGTVFIDDKAMGNAPVEAIVEAGAHKVFVRREGYEDTSSSVVVGVGERKELTVEPQKSAAITSKWWFWASIGVVVVGGTVVTVALLKEKPAGSGDNFSPGQVSGPLVRF